jgi:hypothetical protein
MDDKVIGEKKKVFVRHNHYQHLILDDESIKK